MARTRDMARRSSTGVMSTFNGRTLLKWVYREWCGKLTSPFVYNRHIWKPGKWYRVAGPLVLCANGFHCTNGTRESARRWRPSGGGGAYVLRSGGGGELWEVEVAGNSITSTGSDKLVFRYMRLVRKVPGNKWENRSGSDKKKNEKGSK